MGLQAVTPTMGTGTWNLGPLQEQEALLTTEPSVQSFKVFTVLKNVLLFMCVCVYNMCVRVYEFM